MFEDKEEEMPTSMNTYLHPSRNDSSIVPRRPSDRSMRIKQMMIRVINSVRNMIHVYVLSVAMLLLILLDAICENYKSFK